MVLAAPEDGGDGAAMGDDGDAAGRESGESRYGAICQFSGGFAAAGTKMVGRIDHAIHGVAGGTVDLQPGLTLPIAEVAFAPIRHCVDFSACRGGDETREVMGAAQARMHDDVGAP